MAKTIRVSEEFHSFVAAHKEAEETMEEALIRLTGGPHPSEVAGLLSDETAEAMHEVIEARGRNDPANRERVGQTFHDGDDS